MSFLSSADLYQNQLFKNFFSGIPSERQTVWIQIRPFFYLFIYFVFLWGVFYVLVTMVTATVIIMLRRSVHMTTLYAGQAW